MRNPENRGHNYAVDYSMESLYKAKKKPKWCSEVRWRIELRRRKASTYYSLCNDVVVK